MGGERDANTRHTAPRWSLYFKINDVNERKDLFFSRIRYATIPLDKREEGVHVFAICFLKNVINLTDAQNKKRPWWSREWEFNGSRNFYGNFSQLPVTVDDKRAQ